MRSSIGSVRRYTASSGCPGGVLPRLKPRSRSAACCIRGVSVAVSAASERHANPAHGVVGRILGNYPHDDPAASLRCLEPAHIPYVLASAAAALVTVILNGDFEPFPAHVQ